MARGLRDGGKDIGLSSSENACLFITVEQSPSCLLCAMRLLPGEL